jgi:hypothetical protein
MVQYKELCQMGKKNGLVFGSVATPKNQLLSVFVKENQSGKFNLKYLHFCSFINYYLDYQALIGSHLW